MSNITNVTFGGMSEILILFSNIILEAMNHIYILCTACKKNNVLNCDHLTTQPLNTLLPLERSSKATNKVVKLKIDKVSVKKPVVSKIKPVNRNLK